MWPWMRRWTRPERAQSKPSTCRVLSPVQAQVGSTGVLSWTELDTGCTGVGSRRNAAHPPPQAFLAEAHGYHHLLNAGGALAPPRDKQTWPTPFQV